MTRTWHSSKPSTPDLAEIAELLTDGGVVLLPTDTIYGLHAVATDAAAVDRLATIKGRDEGKPFVVVGASLEQLKGAGVSFPPRALDLVHELWPGPLTVVLPLREPMPASRGALTLAVRVPALEWLRQLVSATGPLASTSANLSGEPPIRAPQELAQNVQRKLDGILQIGPLEGKPSTLVDFTGDEPFVIREGDPAFTQKVWKTLRKSL